MAPTAQSRCMEEGVAARIGGLLREEESRRTGKMAPRPVGGHVQGRTGRCTAAVVHTVTGGVWRMPEHTPPHSELATMAHARLTPGSRRRRTLGATQAEESMRMDGRGT